jgi:hypothetical protein
VPSGSVAVVITGGAAFIVIESAFESLYEAPFSVFEAMTVKLLVPTAAEVGVPVIAPVEALSDKPAGKAPKVTAHVIGWVPLATSVWL